MKNVKLVRSIIAMALVLIIALAACTPSAPAGDTPAPSPAPGDDATPADDVTPADDTAPADDSGLQAVTLDFRLIGNSQADIGRITAAVNAYLASIGRPYSVEFFINEWGDWGTVIPLELAAGEPIDLMFISNWAGDVLTQASVGTLRPLNDFLDRYPEIEQILTSDFMNASQVNGRNYALPVNKEKARNFGWLIRTDIADAMGMDYASMSSVAEMEPYFYRAAEEHGMWILPWGFTSEYQFDEVIPNFAITTAPGTSEVYFTQLSEQGILSARRSSQWMADGLMNPNITAEDSFESEFIAGRTWATTSQLKPGAYAERMGAFGGEIPLAQIEFNAPEIANTETTGAMIAIPAAARNPEESFDLIRLLYTDATLINLIIFGQEGIDYEYVDQSAGIVRLIPSAWDFANLGWTLGNQFNNYLTEDESPDKWEQFEAFNAAGRPLPSLGFVADRTDPDFQTWQTNVTATVERFEDVGFGLVPPAQLDATLDRMYSELVASGKYEIIEELQRQFDAWRAAQ